jgi:vacuole membrane protein 1
VHPSLRLGSWIHDFAHRIEDLTVFRAPLRTAHAFAHEMAIIAVRMWRWLAARPGSVALVTAFTLFSAIVINTPQAVGLRAHHAEAIEDTVELAMYCLYWVWLGVLSSIGLGTGLHTFVLHLGPFIAEVTMAAWRCKSLDFETRSGNIVCPATPDGAADVAAAISVWTIMSKVRLEAFMWGAGTAIGELPPYFVARTAAMSDEHVDDDTKSGAWVRW